jgi:hypothetical protein
MQNAESDPEVRVEAMAERLGRASVGRARGERAPRIVQNPKADSTHGRGVKQRKTVKRIQNAKPDPPLDGG